MTERRDFFISYTAKDKEFAEWIAWQIEKAGYSAMIQAWDFRPGGHFVVDMQNAAANCSRTIAVFSQNYMKSLYAQAEWAAAFAQDPTGEKNILIPVRIEECELKGILKQIVYIDLVGLSEKDAVERLISGLNSNRNKPSHTPFFPVAQSNKASMLRTSNPKNLHFGESSFKSHDFISVIQNNLSSEARVVFEIAVGEAIRIGSFWVGVEHLLLALTKHKESLLVDFLQDNAIDPKILRGQIRSWLHITKSDWKDRTDEQVIGKRGLSKAIKVDINYELLPSNWENIASQGIIFTPRLKEIVDSAWSLAGSGTISSPHLLFSIIQHNNNSAFLIFSNEVSNSKADINLLISLLFKWIQRDKFISKND